MKQWNKDDITAILKRFEVVTKQIFLLVTSKSQFKGKGSIYTVQLLCLMFIELIV